MNVKDEPLYSLPEPTRVCGMDVRQTYLEDYSGSDTDVVHGVTTGGPRRRHSYQSQVVSDCAQKPSGHGMDADLAGELLVDSGPGRCHASGMEIPLRPSRRESARVLQVDAVLA